MTTTAVVKGDYQVGVQNNVGLKELARMLATSGFFQDTRDAGQCVIKILAGQELGFGPISSMTGINIIKGKVEVGANMLAAAIKRSGKYNYRVKQHTTEDCSIEFFELSWDGKWASCGISAFSLEDAKTAGLVNQTWQKFGRNMLFARAMSNGFKWYTPDLSGGPLYHQGEISGNVTEQDDLGPLQPPTAPEPPPPSTPHQETLEVMAGKDPAPVSQDSQRATQRTIDQIHTALRGSTDIENLEHLILEVNDGLELQIKALEELTEAQASQVLDLIG